MTHPNAFDQPHKLTCVTTPANPCATIRNKNGAKESLCLSPLVGVNCPGVYNLLLVSDAK